MVVVVVVDLGRFEFVRLEQGRMKGRRNRVKRVNGKKQTGE